MKAVTRKRKRLKQLTGIAIREREIDPADDPLGLDRFEALKKPKRKLTDAERRELNRLKARHLKGEL